MTQPDVSFDHEGNGFDSQITLTIDPLSFFQYASLSKDRWRELLGLTINHCTFGLGIIKKIDGDYIYVHLPERQGKKKFTEFGLDSFQRGYFNNLQIDNILQQKIVAAAAARQEMLPRLEMLKAEATIKPAKKKRKSTKATKKEAEVTAGTSPAGPVATPDD